MKKLQIVAVALSLGVAGAASAGEPTRLDDRALDSITAGATVAIASGFTFGTLSTGLRGRTAERSSSFATFQQQSVNGVVTSSTQLGATSTFTAIGIGPGSTSASGGGGVVLALF